MKRCFHPTEFKYSFVNFALLTHSKTCCFENFSTNKIWPAKSHHKVPLDFSDQKTPNLKLHRKNTLNFVA